MSNLFAICFFWQLKIYSLNHPSRKTANIELYFRNNMISLKGMLRSHKIIAQGEMHAPKNI